MNEEHYLIKLNELRQGKIDELQISREEFLTFRQAWIRQEDKENFIGYAQRQGKVTYRYEKSHDEND